jgi:hypothetical protein
MQPTGRKPISRQLKVVAVLFGLFAIYVVYGLYAEKVAERKSLAMCHSIAAGSVTTGLRERALADGANEWQSRWHNLDGTDNLSITYTGAPPFSRHICWVKAKEGRVISAELTYLD